MDNKSPSPAERWAAYCDTLKTTGMEILSSAEGLDSVNQAEGLRYLTRLIKGSYEKYIEFADPLDPHFFKMCDERSGYGGDNPDNIYTACPIQAGEIYEIKGHRGSVWQFNFNLFKMGTDSQYELLGQLIDKALVIDQDGNFIITLGGEPRENNWLPIPDGANQIMLRQTFSDRSKEQEVELSIKLLSSNASITPLSMPDMIQKLDGARDFFTNTGLIMHGWSKDFSKLENILPLTDPQFIAEGGGDPSAFFYMAGWKLQPGEALLIQICDYPADKLWNLALFNFWFESLDYANFRIHTNSDICHKNADGSITLVIADEDPGVDNWLNTTGHRQGQMIMRAWSGGVRPADPHIEKITLNDVNWAEKFQRWH